jgi:hypothetical protein
MGFADPPHGRLFYPDIDPGRGLFHVVIFPSDSMHDSAICPLRLDIYLPLGRRTLIKGASFFILIFFAKLKRAVEEDFNEVSGV